MQVNVNPLYTPRELEHQLNDAGVETIVVFNGSTPTLAEVRANTGLKTVITVGVGDASGATLPSPPVDARLGESVSFAEALAQGGGLPLRPVALTGDDLLFLQYHRRHRPGCPRAPRCRTEISSPTPSSSRPSCRWR